MHPKKKSHFIYFHRLSPFYFIYFFILFLIIFTFFSFFFRSRNHLNVYAICCAQIHRVKWNSALFEYLCNATLFENTSKWKQRIFKTSISFFLGINITKFISMFFFRVDLIVSSVLVLVSTYSSLFSSKEKFFIICFFFSSSCQFNSEREEQQQQQQKNRSKYILTLKTVQYVICYKL